MSGYLFEIGGIQIRVPLDDDFKGKSDEDQLIIAWKKLVREVDLFKMEIAKKAGRTDICIMK